MEVWEKLVAIAASKYIKKYQHIKKKSNGMELIDVASWNFHGFIPKGWSGSPLGIVSGRLSQVLQTAPGAWVGWTQSCPLLEQE